MGAPESLVFSVGLSAVQGARVVMTRGLLDSNIGMGAAAFGAGTEMFLADVTIENTLSRGYDRLGGRGLNIQSGASVRLQRGVIANNRDVGMMAMGSISVPAFSRFRRCRAS